MTGKIIETDADWNESDEVHVLRNLIPCISVDFGMFVKDVAFESQEPIEFLCKTDPQSNTGVRFTMTFTDEMHVRHTVTSKYFHQLMLQVAAIDNKANDERYKERTRRKPKKEKKETDGLPLFAQT